MKIPKKKLKLVIRKSGATLIGCISLVIFINKLVVDPNIDGVFILSVLLMMFAIIWFNFEITEILFEIKKAILKIIETSKNEYEYSYGYGPNNKYDYEKDPIEDPSKIIKYKFPSDNEKE